VTVKRRALLSVLLLVAAWLNVPDTVTAASAQDPEVTFAQTISCGDLTVAKDGVQQP
jgi:hypothetical protein